MRGVEKSGKPALVRPEVTRAKLLEVEVRFWNHDPRLIQRSSLGRGNRVFYGRFRLMAWTVDGRRG